MFEKIPNELKELNQWVCWKGNKIPVRPNGQPASVTDSSTWSDFDACVLGMTQRHHGILGIGFVFTDNDPYIGIDFDGCRDPKSKVWQDWARKWIQDFGSYAEMSPSETGAKVIIRAKPLFESGKKADVSAKQVAEKLPGVEMYHAGRYFTLTGNRINGMPSEVKSVNGNLKRFADEYFSQPIAPAPTRQTAIGGDVFDRACRYAELVDPAISGSSGHNVTFRLACALMLGFELTEEQAFQVLSIYNQRCQPPWSDKELWHKVRSANKQPGERGYLKNAQQDQWQSIETIHHSKLADTIEASGLTMQDVATEYLDRMGEDGPEYIETGLPRLDYCLGGGLERGELVVLAARPSHGKSAVAMQMIHHVTGNGMPCLMVSEEMGNSSIGKRIIAYASEVPADAWSDGRDQIRDDLELHFEKRAHCFIESSCGNINNVVSLIEKHVEQNNVEMVVVDYAQLIEGIGKSKYEKVSDVSTKLAKVSKRLNVIVVMLCQLNREIENRNSFVPTNADLRDSGQIEQDADVIIFLVWPHRKDQNIDKWRYQIFISKNRNREIVEGKVECRFNPNRQMLLAPAIEDHKNYKPEFGMFNNPSVYEGDH